MLHFDRDVALITDDHDQRLAFAAGFLLAAAAALGARRGCAAARPAVTAAEAAGFDTAARNPHTATQRVHERRALFRVQTLDHAPGSLKVIRTTELLPYCATTMMLPSPSITKAPCATRPCSKSSSKHTHSADDEHQRYRRKRKRGRDTRSRQHAKAHPGRVLDQQRDVPRAIRMDVPEAQDEVRAAFVLLDGQARHHTGAQLRCQVWQ